MKFLRLVVRNALRNKLRTGLTVGGTGFLIFVLVFMMTALSEMSAWEGETIDRYRVAVQHSTGLATPLPITLENFLQRDEVRRHASYVAKFNWIGAYYQEKTNFFPNMAVDHQFMREMWDEYVIPDKDYRALCETKNGCLVGRDLAKNYGWKVGDAITLIGQIYPFDPQLRIVGLFTHDKGDLRLERQLFFRWDYYDELMGGKKQVGLYWLRGRGSDDVPKLKDIIDSWTKNSSDPTETLTEREFGAQFGEMMGNIKLLFTVMGVIVLIIMVLMTGNTIAMVARERVTEIAVLRTLGFTRSKILFLILGESVVVAGAGCLLSVGGAFFLFNVVKLSPSPQFFPYFFVTGQTMAVAAGVAVVSGLLSAAVPAIRASRRSIVDGLRQVV